MERHLIGLFGEHAFHQQGRIDVLPQRLNLHRVVSVAQLRCLERLVRGLDLRDALDIGKLLQVVIGQTIGILDFKMVKRALVEHPISRVLKRGAGPADAEEYANAKRGEHEDAEERYKRLLDIGEQLGNLRTFHGNPYHTKSVARARLRLTVTSCIRPSRMRTTRSAIRVISSLWVTMTMVVPFLIISSITCKTSIEVE